MNNTRHSRRALVSHRLTSAHRTGRPAELIYYVIVRTIVCIDAAALYDSLAQFLELARDRFKQVAYGGCSKRQDPELKFYVEGDLDGAIGMFIWIIVCVCNAEGNNRLVQRIELQNC